MQTIQYRKPRILEMKSLAKNQVCAIFHMRDIRVYILPKFITLWRRHVGVHLRGTNGR